MLTTGDGFMQKNREAFYFLIVGGLAGTSVTVALFGTTYRAPGGLSFLPGVIAVATVLVTVLFAVLQRPGGTLIGRREKKVAELTHLARLVMVGEISASIIHEIAHSISSILINVEAMELSLAKEDKLALAAIIADLKRDQYRANQVVQRMRVFLSNRELQLERTNVNETVTCILDLLNVDLKKRDVAVKVNLTPDLSAVFADPVHLQQVLLNLFTNAMDAMIDKPSGSRVLEVNTSWHGEDQVEVIVSDSGSGMTRDQLEHAFDMFFTTKKTGMGLGLSVTRWIVQAHHGAIWAEQRPGGGTSFHFTVPLAVQK